MQSEPQPESGRNRRPKPARAGKRPARFGFIAIVVTFVLTSVIVTVVNRTIFSGNGSPEPIPPEPPGPGQPAGPETGAPPENPPDPPRQEIDPHHPLAGRKHILWTQPGRWRHFHLSYTGGLTDMRYPLATVRNEGKWIWELVAVEGNKDVYRIICRTPDSDGHWDGAGLSYTRFDGRDDPFARLGKQDPHSWQIIPVEEYDDRFTIKCFGSEFHGHALTLEADHDFEKATGSPIAALKKKAATWKILSKAELPEPPREVNHVIIFPKSKIGGDELKKVSGWAKDIVEHLKDEGSGSLILHLTFFDETELDKLDAVHEGYSYWDDAIKQLRNQPDPISDSKILPDLTAKTSGDARTIDPFPVVLPLKSTIKVTGIESLWFEDDESWFKDELEEVEEFQSRLDDEPGEPDSDGRVFHGDNYFTYVFVHLEEETSGSSDE